MPRIQRSLLVAGLLLLSTLGVSACRYIGGEENAVRSLPKRITLVEGNSNLQLTGRWQKEDGSETRIPPINSVRIDCDKVAMRCQEAIAVLSPPSSPFGKANSLRAVLFSYEVRSWESTVIRASGTTKALDLDIVIDLKESTANRTARETTARGAVTSSPQRYAWSLQ